MSNIENGNTGISLSMACKIAHVLECSLDELVYRIKEHKDDDMNMPLSVCSLGDFVRAMKMCVVQTQHETTDKDDDSKNITDLKEKQRKNSSLRFADCYFSLQGYFICAVISKRQSPLSTRSPGFTWIALMIPSIGAESVVSIFMASVIIKGVPLVTA